MGQGGNDTRTGAHGTRTAPARLTFSRRALLRASAVGAAALATGAAVPGIDAEADVTQDQPLAAGGYSLNQDWLFGGVYAPGAEQPGASESGDQAITLPHTVTPLSWSDWAPSTWEKVWIYRKHLSGAAVSGGRAFVDFQGVMTSATVWCNGTQIATHQGGYLPFGVELTGHLSAGDNVLAVAVDGTLQDVPPNNPAGDAAIDYLQPAGIYRDVSLRIVPEVFVSDVFAKPTDVLSGAPGLDALVTLDAGAAPGGPVSVTATVTDAAGTAVGSATQSATLGETGPTQLTVSVNGLSGISLWSPESPALYDVAVTVTAPGGASHTYRSRTGFRDAQFHSDGFYLNGSRYQIFGLNRHQHFPYVGGAAAARLQRRDAYLLRNELNCNMVRCSHYPQSDWFLDACDELGLMVWEEPPGWGYVGQDAQFQNLVLQNVTDMIVRDRSRPSVIVWATRLNETTTLSTAATGPANAALYDKTDALAAQLDGTRQTTGAMNNDSTDGWHQQVFAYDDYDNVANQDAKLNPPLTLGGQAIPYFVSESVGALDGAPLYRWIDSSATLTLQAKLHAQVHSQAGAPGYAGLLGWAGIDYATLNGAATSAPQIRPAATTDGSGRVWRNLKTCGVLDPFRTVKPGGAFYAAQAPSAGNSFVTPAFTWDPGDPAQTEAIVFTDCASVRVTVQGSSPLPDATPDAAGYPHLVHPPAFVDLPAVGSPSPDLLLEGLNAAGAVVATAQMSATVANDRLVLTADDAQLVGDGSDATRITARVLDQYGNQRGTGSGTVALAATGPATLHTDPSFDLGAYGGVTGAVLVSAPGAAGTVTVTATPTQSSYGTRSVTVQVAAGSLAAASAGTGGVRVLNPEAVAAVPAPTPAPAPAVVPAAAPPAARPPARLPSVATIRADLRRMLTTRGPSAHAARVMRHGDTLSFRAPSAGTLVVGWYALTRVTVPGHPHRTRTRRVLVATATAHIHHSGRARIHLHLTGRGRTLLRALARSRRRSIALLAEASFTAKGGRTVTASRHITLPR